MRGSRKVPGPIELRQQHIQYTNHLRHLQGIHSQRSNRRGHSTHDSLPQQLKMQLINHSHMARENQTAKTHQQNVKIAHKLHQTVSTIVTPGNPEGSGRSLTRGLRRQQQRELAQENARIYNKLLDSEPVISNSHLKEQYRTLNQIRSRLRKYDSSCKLKAQRVALGGGGKSPPTRPTRPKVKSFYSGGEAVKMLVGKGSASPRQLLSEWMQRRLLNE